MGSTIESEKIRLQKELEASGDAAVIAMAINNLADAIREHARAMSGNEEAESDEQFDLAGNPI